MRFVVIARSSLPLCGQRAPVKLGALPCRHGRILRPALYWIQAFHQKALWMSSPIQPRGTAHCPARRMLYNALGATASAQVLQGLPRQCNTSYAVLGERVWIGNSNFSLVPLGVPQ